MIEFVNLPKLDAGFTLCNIFRFVIPLRLYLPDKEKIMEAGKYTNLQLELLDLFQHEVSENELREIRELLGKYFANKATEEADKLWKEKAGTMT